MFYYVEGLHRVVIVVEVVEHIVHIDGVTGSSPVQTTKKPPEMAVLHENEREANCMARIIRIESHAVAKLFACVFSRG